MTTARVTQDTIRLVSNATPNAVITQQTIRVVSAAVNHARITQCAMRVVSSNAAAASTARPVIFICT